MFIQCNITELRIRIIGNLKVMLAMHFKVQSWENVPPVWATSELHPKRRFCPDILCGFVAGDSKILPNASFIISKYGPMVYGLYTVYR